MITMRKLFFALVLGVAVLICSQTVQLAEGEANSAAPEILHNDPRTWPISEQGLVKFFSIEAHQQQIGFSLEKMLQSPDWVHWYWTANGWSGEISVSVRSSVRETQDALVSKLVQDMFMPKRYAPSGKMVGDIAWLSQSDNRSLAFYRGNVAVWIEIKEWKESDALNELTRLSRSIVEAIDSEEVVKAPSLVKCPKIEVSFPDKLEIGDEATIRIVAEKAKSAKLRYHCGAAPYGLVITKDGLGFTRGGPKFTPTGEVLYTFVARKAGEVTFTVYATDVHGMTRTVKKIIQIVSPAGIQPLDENMVSCPVCGALVPPGCPRCGAIFNLTD